MPCKMRQEKCTLSQTLMQQQVAIVRSCKSDTVNSHHSLRISYTMAIIEVYQRFVARASRKTEETRDERCKAENANGQRTDRNGA
jgi:hypothetical protein